MIKLLIFILIFTKSYANEIDINIIVENCKACHNLQNRESKKIPKLLDLSKDEFITLMKNYRNQKDNSVMNRISKPLTSEDIKKMAEIIYE